MAHLCWETSDGFDMLSHPVSNRSVNLAARRALRSATAGLAVAGVVGLVAMVGAQPVSAEENYTVREHETLSHVAVRTGVPVAALVQANGLADANHVRVGQTLVIPSGGSAGGPGAAASTVTYEVKPGDTLSEIALGAGISTRELAELNELADRHTIRIGQKLQVPAGSGIAVASSGTYPGLPQRIVDMPERLALIPHFEKWAAANNIPVDLLMAIAWQESGWNNAALSNKGARGIGQLMPVTEVWVATSLIGRPELSAANPEENIRISARYVRWLLDRMGGDERRAIAGYYQGPTSVSNGPLYPSTELYIENVLVHRQFFTSN